MTTLPSVEGRSSAAPCTEPPHEMVIALQLRQLGLGSTHSVDDQWQPPTNLRVVELSSASLGSVHGGIGSWKAVLGAGRRGWVVDTSAGPNPDAVETVDAAVPPLQAHSPVHGRNRTYTHSRTTHPSNRIVFRDAEERKSRNSRSLVPPLHRSLSLSAEPVQWSTSGPQKAQVRNEVVRNLPEEHPRSIALRHLAAMGGSVPVSTGWHSRKMEVLLGYGLLGREVGNYAWLAYQYV